MNGKTIILLPVYNAGQFLPECLDSVIAQTHTEWQLIACNDAPKGYHSAGGKLLCGVPGLRRL